MPDIIDREANTREEAVQWAADMIVEIKRLRARVAELELQSDHVLISKLNGTHQQSSVRSSK